MTFANLLNRGSLCCLILALAITAMAQPMPAPFPEKNKTAKPYQLLTNGRQITIRSTQSLESVMVWTSGGHRVVEDKAIDKNEYQFNLTISARIYFVMIRMKDGKSYSEKIGVR